MACHPPISSIMPPTQIRCPELGLLATDENALKRGWSPKTIDREPVRQAHLDAIVRDPEGLLAGLDDPTASNGRIRLPDGTTTEHLPARTWYITEEESAFCDAIGLR